MGQALAGEVVEMGQSAAIICLYGELGSGKTTFAQGFAKGLGIGSRLLSPTFIIVRRYQIPKSSKFFYHIDLYRIQTKEELEGLGLREIFAEPSATIIIEWADRLEKLLPKKRIDVYFSLMGLTKREITIKKIS